MPCKWLIINHLSKKQKNNQYGIFYLLHLLNNCIFAYKIKYIMKYVNEILKKGVLVTKLSENQWLVTSAEKERRLPAKSFRITFDSNQKKFIEHVEDIIERDGEVKVSATDYENFKLSLKMAAMTLRKHGLLSYRKRTDGNRLYFHKSLE